MTRAARLSEEEVVVWAVVDRSGREVPFYYRSRKEARDNAWSGNKERRGRFAVVRCYGIYKSARATAERGGADGR